MVDGVTVAYPVVGGTAVVTTILDFALGGGTLSPRNVPSLRRNGVVREYLDSAGGGRRALPG